MSYNLIRCNCGCIYAEADGHNCNKVSDAYRIEELEAKLAKAVEFFDFLDENYRHVWGDTARSKIRALYVELKGQADE